MMQPVPSTTATAYLALGSNLGDRAGNLHRCAARHRPIADVASTSRLYESPRPTSQTSPTFSTRPAVSAHSFRPGYCCRPLSALMTALGRQRAVGYGPRAIDIDILFYDDVQLETKN